MISHSGASAPGGRPAAPASTQRSKPHGPARERRPWTDEDGQGNECRAAAGPAGSSTRRRATATIAAAVIPPRGKEVPITITSVHADTAIVDAVSGSGAVRCRVFPKRSMTTGRAPTRRTFRHCQSFWKHQGDTSNGDHGPRTCSDSARALCASSLVQLSSTKRPRTCARRISYSVRRASKGLRRAPRRAGSQHAMSATVNNRTVVAADTAGSPALTP